MCSPSSAGKPACSYAHTESNGVGSSLRETEKVIETERTERSRDRQRIQLPLEIQDNITKLNLREKKQHHLVCVYLYRDPDRRG